ENSCGEPTIHSLSWFDVTWAPRLSESSLLNSSEQKRSRQYKAKPLQPKLKSTIRRTRADRFASLRCPNVYRYFLHRTNPISTFSNFLSVSIPERTEEMSKWGLIRKSYLVTLNQRVQGSSPCAPTNVFNHLTDFDRAIPTSSRALIPTHRLVLFLMQAAFEADDPNADTQPKISVNP